jgi:hypothetical protein
MTKLTYQEGDVFGVPLEEGRGYALGLVARVAKRGGTVLGYFFGKHFGYLPIEIDMSALRPQDAILTVRFGDLHLMDGRWPIISRTQGWDRGMWPMPKFVRIEPVSNKVYLVSFSDDDPSARLTEKRIDDNSANYARDSLKGASGLEKTLSRLLNIL